MSKTKCDSKTWCKPMNEFTSDQYGSGRRIFVSECFRPSTGKTDVAAGYFFGRKKNEFIWLNFCPWCGSDIRAFKDEKP